MRSALQRSWRKLLSTGAGAAASSWALLPDALAAAVACHRNTAAIAWLRSLLARSCSRWRSATNAAHAQRGDCCSICPGACAERSHHYSRGWPDGCSLADVSGAMHLTGTTDVTTDEPATGRPLVSVIMSMRNNACDRRRGPSAPYSCRRYAIGAHRHQRQDRPMPVRPSWRKSPMPEYRG